MKRETINKASFWKNTFICKIKKIQDKRKFYKFSIKEQVNQFKFINQISNQMTNVSKENKFQINITIKIYKNNNFEH